MIGRIRSHGDPSNCDLLLRNGDHIQQQNHFDISRSNALAAIAAGRGASRVAAALAFITPLLFAICFASCTTPTLKWAANDTWAERQRKHVPQPRYPRRRYLMPRSNGPLTPLQTHSSVLLGQR